MIAPHRKKQKTQDGRKLRRYRRRWQVERFFAWLFNFRRTLARQKQKAENYLAFLLFACMKIMLRYF
ncbi:transposase [Pontibacter sp. CAU 1760]